MRIWPSQKNFHSSGTILSIANYRLNVETKIKSVVTDNSNHYRAD